jgi:hypothetical protein
MQGGQSCEIALSTPHSEAVVANTFMSVSFIFPAAPEKNEIINRIQSTTPIAFIFLFIFITSQQLLSFTFINVTSVGFGANPESIDSYISI